MTTAAPTRRSLRDRVARVAELVATPLVPADYVDLFAPLRSADLRARILRITPETADASTIELLPGRAWAGHTPGQYVRIGVDVDGVRQWRAYSITSTTQRTLTITVKAIPDGVVSNHLVRRATVGTVVQLDQATGDFVLPAAAPAKALFVTAGSGITPVMGMLRSTELEDVVLVHSAPTSDDVIFARELRELAAKGRIRLVELHTDNDGMLSTDQLLELVPDLAEREAWACGPSGMLDMLTDWWPTESLNVERFRPSVLVTGEGGTVAFSRTGATVEAAGDVPLLVEGEKAGVLMPSGCRMGICFGCVLPLREGAVRDLRTGAITTAAVGDGVLIQTCVSAAAGACDLDV
ncbi:MAG: Flavodoxin reductase [Frankiales bacterium]|nr:Flavodoxin reductase [Frankiales bacterium]